MSNFYFTEYKTLFIHVPKTAGTAFRKGVFKVVEGPAFGQIPEAWDYNFSFAFVRNPYDRLLSLFRMFSMGSDDNSDIIPKLNIAKIMTILRDDSIIYDERRSSIEERIRHHGIPQTHEFNCLHHAAFIGRFETLQNDFQRIAVELQLPSSKLPERNRSNRDRETKIEISQVLLMNIQEYYSEDFKRLNYSLDPSQWFKIVS